MSRAQLSRQLPVALGLLAVSLTTSGCLALGAVRQSETTPTSSAPSTTATVVEPQTSEPSETVTVTVTPSSSSSGPAGSSTSAAPPAEPAGTPVVSHKAFQTPSGNIECALGGGAIECAIEEYDFVDRPQPDDCDLAWSSNQVVLDTEATVGLCHGDVGMVNQAGPGKPTLQYGSVNRVGDISCRSEKSGLTCQNVRSKNGFRISRAALESF